MKVGILTFHCADNYGAVLQAYALQEYLKSLGHEAFIINYRPKYLTFHYRIFVNSLPDGSVLMKLKYFLRNVLIAPIRLKRHLSFASFRKKHLNCLNIDLNEPYNNLDIFIFGSDQIWNSTITNGLDEIFFGNFVASTNKKLIAYAASAGSTLNINNTQKIFFQEHLSKFYAIGVREKSLLNFLKPLQCFLTIDPVLLAGQELFNKIAQYNIKGKYLLLFQLGDNHDVEKIAFQVGRKKKLPIIKINSSSESLKNRKVISSASPELFLSYIKNASYVVTPSFHGTAFSILFKKDFTSVCLSSIEGERIVNLLQQLGLQNRIATLDSSLFNTESIDYSIAYKLYELFRNDSKIFIQKTIGGR